MIEVSHSTLGYDKATKLPLYAQTGVQECWIVDVENRRLEVHKNPKAGVYTLVKNYLPDEKITLTRWDIRC